MNNEPLISIGFSMLSTREISHAIPNFDTDIEVLIAVQGGTLEKCPDSARVIHLESSGLSASRNAVLENALGQYIVIADDDSLILESGVKSVVEYLQKYPDIGLAAAVSEDFEGRPRKNFPNDIRPLTRWNSAHIGSIELIINKKLLLDSGVRFDTSFGLGTPNFLGEEYIFITDALKKGVRCVFLPISISKHNVNSTGSQFGFEKDLRVRAAVLKRVFGRGAPLARGLFAFKNFKRFNSYRLFQSFILGRLG